MTRIVHVEDPDTVALARLFEKAARSGATVRVMVDDDGVKFSYAGQMWSAGVGRFEDTADRLAECRDDTTTTPCPAWCSGTHV